MNGCKVITKSELADMMGVSISYLRRQLNIHYLDDLEKVGYKKNSSYLSPRVYNEFAELYGITLKIEE